MRVIVMGLVILTAALNIKAIEPHLQCWHCSSDTIGAEDFCGIEFKESDIPDVLKEKNLSVLRTCNSSINSEHVRNVCRKTVEEINGKTIVKRFCYYTNKSDSLDHCQHETKNVNRVFCEDCLTDNCNAALKFNLSVSILTANILILFIVKQLEY